MSTNYFAISFTVVVYQQVSITLEHDLALAGRRKLPSFQRCSSLFYDTFFRLAAAHLNLQLFAQYGA
jgi:hypothetical protein